MFRQDQRHCISALQDGPAVDNEPKHHKWQAVASSHTGGTCGQREGKNSQLDEPLHSGPPFAAET